MIERVITKHEAAEFFPPLRSRVNKGEMGRVLIVCGSYDKCGLSMCGAAFFAAKAAYRCGAGIVEIFTPRENYSVLASLVPEAVFSLYGYDEPCDTVAERVALSVSKSDAVVLGCGLGKSETSRAIVGSVLRSVGCPLVIDADGLNIISDDAGLWSFLSCEQRKRTVITPHPGEMARLTGKTIAEILENLSAAASEIALDKGIVCLLKDHNTAISDGKIVYINQSGNPGMATAGMGDVLAGIVGALLAREKKGEFLLCAAVGAYLHGLAGDIAADKIGPYSLVASDLLAEIHSAIAEIFG